LTCAEKNLKKIKFSTFFRDFPRWLLFFQSPSGTSRSRRKAAREIPAQDPLAGKNVICYTTAFTSRLTRA